MPNVNAGLVLTRDLQIVNEINGASNIRTNNQTNRRSPWRPCVGFAWLIFVYTSGFRKSTLWFSLVGKSSWVPTVRIGNSRYFHNNSILIVDATVFLARTSTVCAFARLLIRWWHGLRCGSCVCETNVEKTKIHLKNSLCSLRLISFKNSVAQLSLTSSKYPSHARSGYSMWEF